MDQGIAHAQVRRRACASRRVGSYNNSNSFHIPQANGSWVAGVGTTLHARRASARAVDGGVRRAAGGGRSGGQSTYGDTLIPLLGVISEVDAVLQLRHDRATCCRSARRCGGAMRLDEYEFYVQDSWKVGAEPDRDGRRCATACSRRRGRSTACRSRPTSTSATGSSSGAR